MKLNTYIAFFFIILVVTTHISCAAAKPDGPLTLAAQGRSDYVIVLAEDAIPSERLAAAHLKKYFRTVTGVSLDIRSENEVADSAPQILVGSGARASKNAPIDGNQLGRDGIVLRTAGKNLILVGGRPLGTAYAVDSFLENYLGVRWWTSDESIVPKRNVVRISPINVKYIPTIKYRGINASGVSADADFAARLKLNGHRTLAWCGPNTFDILLPIEKYFKARPEWYSDPANGDKPCTAASQMPQNGQWQLNLTDDSARAEIAKVAQERLRADPETESIAILPNDNTHVCVTPEQQALLEREGSASGMLLKFVNGIAAEIEKEFPKVMVETLAYRDTYSPPKFERPRHNVAIYLSSITADFARPLTAESNKEFQDSIKGWKAITNNVFVWDYVTNFWNYTLPHPNMNVLGPNVRYFAENATGVFEQGDDYTGGTGDFAAMKTWILARMMWNPGLDQKKLETEFLQGYYGAAAPYLQQYIDLVQEAFLKNGERLSCSHFNFSYLTLDVMNRATNRFRAAEKAVAGNAVLARRVRRERMALDYAWLLRHKDLLSKANETNSKFEGPKDTLQFAKEFIDNARAFKIPQYSEGVEVEGSAAARLMALARPASPLPAFLRGVDSNDIVDVDPSMPSLSAGAKSIVDAASPTGFAIAMPGSTNEWGIQWGLSDARLATGRWRCYLFARIDAPGVLDGNALGYGGYDTVARTEAFIGTQKFQQFTPGKYTQIDLGVRQWNMNMLVWIAPPNRADVNAIYIGRILFVREKD